MDKSSAHMDSADQDNMQRIWPVMSCCENQFETWLKYELGSVIYYACMYVCMYVCIYIYIYIYI